MYTYISKYTCSDSVNSYPYMLYTYLLMPTIGALNLWPNINQLSCVNNSATTRSNFKSRRLINSFTLGLSKAYLDVASPTKFILRIPLKSPNRSL